MKSKYLFFILLSVIANNSYAGDFETAINTARAKCSGISNKLSDLKKMAGINTAITGVGIATATGATVVGVVKASKDKDLETILSVVDKNKPKSQNPSVNDILEIYDAYIKKYKTIDEAQTALERESKTLGHWRTGLLGTSTATNVAGSIIAGNNSIDDNLSIRIGECIESIDSLKDAVIQARTEGINVENAKKIINECEMWKTADLSVINNKARGAMLSSIVGATTGVAGTVTSAIANSNNIRNGDEKKEKNLNTASNVLAAGTAVASGAATIFNAKQISAVKKIIAIADKCEEVLK